MNRASVTSVPRQVGTIDSVMATAVLALAGVALTLNTLARGSPAFDPPKDAPNDLPGRVVDKAGAVVAGGHVWAVAGPGWTPETVATVTTDVQGRFVVPFPRNQGDRRDLQDFGVIARGSDGSIGWQRPAWPNSPDGKNVEIELKPVGDVPGRLTDQNARAIAGVEVATVLINPAGEGNAGNYIRLSPEVTALLRTTTAADGTFVLKGIPRGARIFAAIAAPAFGTPTISWDTTRAETIVLDGRLGRIKGRIKPPETRGLVHQLPLRLHHESRLVSAPAGTPDLVGFRYSSTDKNGVFQFDSLPPGRYVVSAYFDQDGIIATRPQHEVEVGPGAVAELEISVQRVPMITGRIVDAQTGKGIAGVSVRSLLREEGRNSNLVVGEATADAEGKYRIPGRPGWMLIVVQEVPPTYLGLIYGQLERWM